MLTNNPRLFGINKSNRNYLERDTWGKNQFNSSFPTALANYMYFKKLDSLYIKLDKNMNPVIEYISIDDLYGIDPLGEDTFFAFESHYTPFQKYIIGTIPRNDLVIQNLKNGNCISTFEIKLTALPDNASCMQTEDKYGCEIVIRPDTIIYLACSIIDCFQDNITELEEYLGNFPNEINDWTEANQLIPYIDSILESIECIVKNKNEYQSPVIIEPIWKTKGKSPKLEEDCLDIFVWSNFGMLKLFLPKKNEQLTKISRHTRSMIWLYKMLYDYVKAGHFDGNKIIDELSYNTKNDKAFSTNGIRTNLIMNCQELIKPRIKKSEIKNIILGGGQNLLSPERRFDAIIFNSPDLFE